MKYYYGAYIKEDEGRARTTYGRGQNCTHRFSRTSEDTRIPIWKYKHGWESNIKVTLKEVVHEGVGWIQVAEDKDQLRALVNTIINLRVS
jgi:hypothetical protein